MGAMRLLTGVLVVQVALAGTLIALVATDNVPFVSGEDGRSGGEAQAAAAQGHVARRSTPAPRYNSVKRQVALGPRPAGSAPSKVLAERLRRALPGGRFQAVPGGLRNVVGVVPGRTKRVVVVGAHYDTKDLPGFVGANDGAAGTAVMVQLARTIKPRTLKPTLVFIAFDGEEAPAGASDADFYAEGLRGSKVAAKRYKDASAMVLLDFIGQREPAADGRRQRRCRPVGEGAQAPARRAGVARVFPSDVQGSVQDDHTPFIKQGVPAVDLIDFDYACLHKHLRQPGPDPRAQPGRHRRDDDEAAAYTLTFMPSAPEKLLLAAPRGYCAGVDRAVQTVEHALDLYGAPVYVRKEIVHNKHVVEQLRERGAIFVEEEGEVPEGETVVFSAHGVSPAVHANAEARELKTIDATCPLVTKVHVEAKKFAAEGYTIVMIGHNGHEEVEGTMGEAPDHIILIETEDEVDDLEVPDPDKVAFISQTTLAVDETRAIILKLREKFPNITGPAHRRHLLRHHQPPDGRAPDGGGVRPGAGHRLAQLVQLQPPGRGRPRPRRRLLPDRQRVPGARGVAGGQARRGHLLRRQRPRGAGPAAGRLLPRARHRRRLGVRGRPGGRALHAAEADPEGAGGAYLAVSVSPPQSRPRALRPCRTRSCAREAFAWAKASAEDAGMRCLRVPWA